MNRALSQPELSQSHQIRVVQSEEEFLALEHIQQIAWERILTTAPMLKISSQLGGIVLAVFPTEQKTPIGFVYSFPAIQKRELWHHSHLLAIHPDWRGKGLATALKWAQREQVLAQGLSHMTWTFDPLVARNAHLNLNKLGAIVREYHPAFYPTSGDFPNDRLMVEWDLSSKPRSTPATPTEGPFILQVTADGQPSTINTNWKAHPTLWVEVPQQEPTDDDLCLAWRLALREALYPPLQHGYTLTRLNKENGRTFYVLEQSEVL